MKLWYTNIFINKYNKHVLKGTCFGTQAACSGVPVYYMPRLIASLEKHIRDKQTKK